MKSIITRVGWFAAGAILMGAIATGCSASARDDFPGPDDFTVTTVEVDGRKVRCVHFEGGTPAGLSCDFGGAR